MMGFDWQLLASPRSVRDSETLHQNAWWTASEQQWEIDLCVHTCVCATHTHTHTSVVCVLLFEGSSYFSHSSFYSILEPFCYLLCIWCLGTLRKYPKKPSREWHCRGPGMNISIIVRTLFAESKKQSRQKPWISPQNGDWVLVTWNISTVYKEPEIPQQTLSCKSWFLVAGGQGACAD